MSAPNRHALLTTSCINSEVMVCNRKLHKRMKLFEYVKIIDSDLQREYLTKHGLHMNIVGKELMAQRIPDHIRKIFIGRETSPIILKLWQELIKSSQEKNEEGKATHSRTLGRIGKKPITKRDDFLWTVSVIK